MGDRRPSDAPREVGARARRRSWAEPGVRLWWLSALVVGGIGLWVAGVNVMGALADRRLIREGTRVEATIVEADGKRHEYVIRTDMESGVRLAFTLPGSGERQEVSGILKGHKQPVRVTKTMPIYVDPQNPQHWTHREEVDWTQALFVPGVVAGAALPLLVIALALRTRALRTWREGQAMRAIAVEVKQSAGAPMSRLVRYTLADEKDSRLYAVVIPTRAGVPAAGEVFWVVADRRRPGTAVAAAAYL